MSLNCEFIKNTNFFFWEFEYLLVLKGIYIPS